MATAAREIPAGMGADYDKVIDFNVRVLVAPFFLRCAALAIDYLVFLIIPVTWLLIDRFMDDGSSKPGLGSLPWILGLVVAVGDMVVLPIARGRSVGKMLTGLTVLRKDGSDLTIGALILRNVVGYALTLLTGGLGFLLAAITPAGRALHDYVGGTVVVSGRKTVVTK